jgi:translation initiation factor 4A
MSRRVQVLVGTPDCILDVLQRHALSPDHIRLLFLDEADELLTGGSKDKVSFISYQLYYGNQNV